MLACVATTGFLYNLAIAVFQIQSKAVVAFLLQTTEYIAKIIVHHSNKKVASFLRTFMWAFWIILKSRKTSGELFHNSSCLHLLKGRILWMGLLHTQPNL